MFDVRLIRFKNILLRLFLIVIFLTSSATVSAQSYWDAIFELGFDPDSQGVDRVLAYERIEMFFQFRKMLTENLETDEKVLSTISEAESRMKSFDVGNLYEILPYSDVDTEWRAIGVRGGRNSEIYRLHMADPEVEEWAASFPAAHPGIWGRQKYFGDLGLRAFIRPARQDTFRFITEGQLYLADLPAANFVRVIQSLMATAWLRTSRGENPPMEFLKESSLGEPGKRVMYGLVRDFPHLFEIISRYFVIEKIVSQMLTYDGNTVMFDVRIRMHREAFKEDYPTFEKLLDRLENMVFLRSRTLDEQNHLMSTAEFDGKTFRVCFVMRDGKMMAMHDDWFTEEISDFSLTDPGSTRFHNVSDINLNIAGLQIDINAIRRSLVYSYENHALQLTRRFQQEPESVEVSGRIIGLIPIWLVNLLIPSNIEDMIREFFAIMADSNDGEGSSVEFGSYPEEDLRQNFWLRTDTEVLANGTMKFGFNLQQRMTGRRRDLNAEIRAFRQKLWEAFYQDYLRIQ